MSATSSELRRPTGRCEQGHVGSRCSTARTWGQSTPGRGSRVEREIVLHASQEGFARK